MNNNLTNHNVGRADNSTGDSSPKTMDIVRKGLKKRYRVERRFRLLGLLAIMFSLLSLSVLFISIFSNGIGAFWQTRMKLDIALDLSEISKTNPADANYEGIIKQTLREMFPEVTSRQDRRKLYALVSSRAAYQLKDVVRKNPERIGTVIELWVLADDDVDVLIKSGIERTAREGGTRLDENQIAWVRTLTDQGRIKKGFNIYFFTGGDSREPELAGIWGAACGSFLTLLVTLALSFPIGVAAAVYLEEFAPKNRWTDVIEVNINNLAAVPSIVFGLLGLAVFLGFFGMPRSSPLVGGFVLTLMTLPTIIIASRASLKAVPPSIREAALGIGASRMQMIAHHVLPLAMPGMLTGTILGMAQALGETAPLLMIGMVAFIVDIPGGFTDPATVLPVQIFLWADSPERAFLERTSAAIMVLLIFLIAMNATAVFLRKRFERRW